MSLLLLACDKKNSTAENLATENILGACPDFSETGKPPIVQGAECGKFAVKEDPQDMNSREIFLNILRLPAISSTPQSDPLFIIAGGPGQSAVGIAEHILYTFNEVRKNRDIVFVDQRGTGKSNPLSCSAFDDFYHQLTLIEQQQRLKQAVIDCLAVHGEQLEFYTTPYAVQDMENVRTALGYKKINLWGVSYGTRVALEYMRRFPESTRSSVLDGVAPAFMALPWSSEEDALASLQQLNQQCAASAECAEAYGNLILKAESIAEKLSTQPASITVKHPRTQASLSMVMNHQVFGSILRMALYTREAATLLPLAIANANEQDYQLFASLISMTEEQGELTNISHAMHFTILCNEDYPQYKDRDFAQAQHFFRIDLVGTMRDLCELWPHYTMPAEYFTPVKSAVPTLLLSGQRDPVTPPRWAESVMPHLSESTHLVAPGGHHSITGSGCIPQLIAQFIHNGNAVELDTRCVKKISPLPSYSRIKTAAEKKDYR